MSRVGGIYVSVFGQGVSRVPRSATGSRTFAKAACLGAGIGAEPAVMPEFAPGTPPLEKPRLMPSDTVNKP